MVCDDGDQTNDAAIRPAVLRFKALAQLASPDRVQWSGRAAQNDFDNEGLFHCPSLSLCGKGGSLTTRHVAVLAQRSTQPQLVLSQGNPLVGAPVSSMVPRMFCLLSRPQCRKVILRFPFADVIC